MLAEEHNLKFWRATASTYADWAQVRMGEPRAEAFRAGLSAYADLGARLHVAVVMPLLAEVELATGRRDEALAAIERGLNLAAETGLDLMRPRLLRLRGDALAETDSIGAVSAYREALSVAGAQGARAGALIAAFARQTLQSKGEPAEAHAVLAPALEGFSPTPLFPAIAEAQALLAALAETDEVKADAAQRRRITQLQAAYGAALIAARGFGAPETTEAFARARKFAAGDDSLERLAADYGLWVGSYVRGDLPAMKAQAAAFLADVAAKPDSGEAGVAHRVQGMTTSSPANSSKPGAS